MAALRRARVELSFLDQPDASTRGLADLLLGQVCEVCPEAVPLAPETAWSLRLGLRDTWFLLPVDALGAVASLPLVEEVEVVADPRLGDGWVVRS